MIQLNYLRLRSITAQKTYGADIPFLKGLNVIRADNTSGKSTSLQAIIYALGLERSLGPHLTVPLPYAMRERIHATKDGAYEAVHQSYVELELQNSAGALLTVRRDIVGGKNPKLIQTWNTGRLTDETLSGEPRDFFVHDEGSAQREDGFHHFLVNFIGWTLPIVPRFDGSTTSLYIEAIFPMLFIEQKRGWSAVQGPFPTFLRIQDVARRVVEFLLDLDVSKIRRDRAQLRRDINLVEQQWASRTNKFLQIANQIGRVRGLPAAPTAEFAHLSRAEIDIYEYEKWRSLNEVIEEINGALRKLSDEQIPSADSVAPVLFERLDKSKEKYDQLSALAEVVRTELNAELQDRNILERRISALRADLKRNQDTFKLKRLGSTLGQAAAEQICPTCHQTVEAELLATVAHAGMAVEENIEFVRSQIALFETAYNSSGNRIQEIEARSRAIGEELTLVQREIRSLRQSMLQPSEAPSRAKIEDTIRLQARLDQLNTLHNASAGDLDFLKDLASKWVLLQENLKKLPSDEFSDLDKRKIQDLEKNIRLHLNRYGFSSFLPNDIHVSRENFRLVRFEIIDGISVEKELSFDISASDGIRLKWAYYLSILELSKLFPTSHPGVVFFDEPGQQQINAEDLHALFRWAAGNLNDQQLIISTSEPSADVRLVLKNQSCNLVNFEGYILQPIE